MGSPYQHSLQSAVVCAVLFCMPCIGANGNILSEVRAAEAAFENFASTHEGAATPVFEAWDKLMNVEKKLLTLEAHGRVYMAQSVYKAHQLRNGWDLSGIVADDTIHTTEASPPYEPIPCKSGETFQINLAWDESALSRCNFYLGNPAEMHASGYKHVVELRRHGNSVMLPRGLELRDLLLFAIIKPKNGDYRKFVFALRPH
jgi:hypothetical protein